ncbi:MAG: hypothetical protein V5A39_13625 [Haloarculaceae archaeon]
MTGDGYRSTLVRQGKRLFVWLLAVATLAFAGWLLVGGPSV